MKALDRVLTVLNLGVALFLLWAWVGRTEWANGRTAPESGDAVGPLRPWLEIVVVFLIMILVVKLWQIVYRILSGGTSGRRVGHQTLEARPVGTSRKPPRSENRDDGPGPTADAERGPLALVER